MNPNPWYEQHFLSFLIKTSFNSIDHLFLIQTLLRECIKTCQTLGQCPPWMMLYCCVHLLIQLNGLFSFNVEPIKCSDNWSMSKTSPVSFCCNSDCSFIVNLLLQIVEECFQMFLNPFSPCHCYNLSFSCMEEECVEWFSNQSFTLVFCHSHFLLFNYNTFILMWFTPFIHCFWFQCHYLWRGFSLSNCKFIDNEPQSVLLQRVQIMSLQRFETFDQNSSTVNVVRSLFHVFWMCLSFWEEKPSM